jgi:hypothetical protein
MKCEHCKKELVPLNPSVEEYLEHKFCINIFGWKLMLIKDNIEMGCIDCAIDEEQSRQRDDFDEAVSYAIDNEISKGNLIVRE